jgi:hypothetical protein
MIMLQAEIKVGGTYRTRISGALVRVVVVRAVESTERCYGATSMLSPQYRRKVRFEIRREDTGVILPKHRSAGALHETFAPYMGDSTIGTT